ncbi:MAG: hypothetical protein PUB18_02600 [bacterium]|nr:hypothetical protein [bacterium]
MILFTFNNISTELLIVYSLIGFVLVLIGVILLVDRFHHRNKDDLFDAKKLAKNLKALKEEYEEADEEIDILDDEEIVPVENLVVKEKSYVDPIIEFEEGELEKTQAQIDVEEITRALEKAIHEEKRVDPYLKFEEEQEQNAIISYSELERRFDQLYDEGEKIQYLRDDDLPIDLDELYLKNERVFRSQEPTRSESVAFREVDRPKRTVMVDQVGGFKSSPMISPVYGIQREVPITPNKARVVNYDDEIKKTNEFLKTLKELKKNLD